jgi:hypothetical protein
MAKEKAKSYTEAELVDTFGLQSIMTSESIRMMEWLSVEIPTFTIFEQYNFDELFSKAVKNVRAWSEEDLKMKFISGILPLGYLTDNGRFLTYFEKTIFATIEGHYLSTKSDFMVATGVLDMPKKPYFHFQEYTCIEPSRNEPHKKPSGDSMAQLLEAMLIAQHENKNGKPIYGCEVIGKNWNFVVLEDKTYCVSKTYDCTEKKELLEIIAILRKFRHILETELLD